MRTQSSKAGTRLGVTLPVASAILREVGGQRAQETLKRLENADYGWVVNQPMPIPSEYSTADAFARDYLSYNLLRKFPSFDLGIDRIGVAKAAFWQSESKCELQNRYGGSIPYTFDSDVVLPHQTLEAILFIAREKIRKALGPFCLNEASNLWRFSGGASTRLKRACGHSYYKLQGKPHVTREAAVLGICAIWHDEGWRKYFQLQHGRESDPCSWVEIVPGSKYTTVPKTAKTDRGICIEPDLNMFLQLGIGAMIRRRLLGVGINLNDQSHNQRLALIGSRTGSLVTIDLASASDSISLELVRDLVPPDWYRFLEMTRSHYCEIDGQLHRLHKISSMGNGYTFELESLIFWALSSAVLEAMECSDRRLGVYGDDIVIHNSVAERLISVLASCGFETNTDKTFVSGPFRESCGKHYFLGADVSPFAITEAIDGPNRLFLHFNQCGAWWVPLWKSQRLLRSKLPRRMQEMWVPPYMSPESGLIAELDQAVPTYDREKQMWSFSALVPVRRKHQPSGYAAVLSWLRAYRHTLPDDRMYLEKGRAVYSVVKRYTSWWNALA